MNPDLDAAIRRHPSGRREPTVAELGLCGHSDDDRVSADAARWTPTPPPAEPLPWLHGTPDA